MTSQDVELLVDQFGTDIYRFSLKLCRNKNDAEDLYQLTFLKALELPDAIEWNLNPKSYLFSITSNLYKNQLRKQIRRQKIAPTVDIGQESDNMMEAKNNTEQDMIDRLERDFIHDAIMKLPDKIKIPILLFYMFDIGIGEIGGILKIPSGTVKSRLYKGRSQIKAILEEAGYE